MVNLASLLEKARKSEDREAYLPAEREPGFRIGVGVRVVAHDRVEVFVEVVLDPFPDRPQVDASFLRLQSERVAGLQARGYDVSCDSDGTITCERPLAREGVSGELRDLRRLLGSPRRARSSRDD